ncbi:MAG: hypothetical protein M5U34_44615 [Chloroflexi bacterium]|nr:hypothetical protein [Chloroflexota bacterium]
MYENNQPINTYSSKLSHFELIEQLVSVVSKGTALGLSDLASAMFSGYFIESGGAVTPAIEALFASANQR